jgi:predicted RNA binding protein YcfA (HicA-like mRNA interferase family)
MTKLSPVSWKRFEKFLFFIGCYFEREKGDHRIYWREGLIRPVVIPKEKNLPIFIIRNNLRTLDITIEEYLEILKNL